MSPTGGITASMSVSFRPSGSGTFHHLIYLADQDSMHPATVGSDRSHDHRSTIGKPVTTVPFPYLKPLFLPPHSHVSPFNTGRTWKASPYTKHSKKQHGT